MKWFLTHFFLMISLSLCAESEEVNAIPETAAKNVNCFFDFAVKNDYITPRGLLVTNTGVTLQILSGFSIDFYKNPSCFINQASLVLFCWNDLWTEQHHPTAGAWNEFDWSVGLLFTLSKKWKFGVQFIQFVSPPGNFQPESNIEFLLSYSDPYSINPYVRWFWAVAGDSTVVVGRPGDTFDVECGIIPTFKLCRSVITLPTWITFGPPSFWNGGDLGLKHKDLYVGVFSTGMNIRYSPSWWYFYLGGQYYYLINDNLLQAQTITLGVSSYKKGHRNVGVATVGFGF